MQLIEDSRGLHSKVITHEWTRCPLFLTPFLLIVIVSHPQVESIFMDKRSARTISKRITTS